LFSLKNLVARTLRQTVPQKIGEHRPQDDSPDPFPLIDMFVTQNHVCKELLHPEKYNAIRISLSLATLAFETELRKPAILKVIAN